MSVFLLFLFFSEVAEAVVNSFTISIESLNIMGIGLGPLGFLALGRKLEKVSKKLLSINIRSKAKSIASIFVYNASLCLSGLTFVLWFHAIAKTVED